MRAALSTVIAAAAFSAVLPARAEYFADTPMPDRPGCEIIDRVPIFDGYRHGTRVYWRCPRFSEPEEEECCESAEPDEPQVDEADTSEPDSAPESEPEYTYSPPATPAASPPRWRPPYQSSPDIPAAGGLLVVLVVVALLVIAVITNKGNASSLERDVRETRALTQRLNAAAREADAHIAAFLKKEGLDG